MNVMFTKYESNESEKFERFSYSLLERYLILLQSLLNYRYYKNLNTYIM